MAPGGENREIAAEAGAGGEDPHVPEGRAFDDRLYTFTGALCMK